MNQEITPAVNVSPFTIDGLRILTEAIGLSLLPPTLRVCVDYYKNVRRDPAAEELVLFDKLSKNGLKRADHATISEMYTESDATAALFADLMTHRGSKHRDGTSPLSLADLSRIVGSVARPMEGSVFADTAIGFSAAADRALAAEGYRKTVATGNASDDLSVGLRVADASRQKPLAGDYVYVFRPTRNENGGKAFSEFLLKHLEHGVIKSVKLMQRKADGLLSALLDLDCGLSVHPKMLFGSEEFKLADLERYFDGALVVAAPARSADLLLDAVCELQPPIHVATIEKDDHLRITRNGKMVSYPLSFLQALSLRRSYRASLSADTSAECDAKIARRGICEIGGRTYSLIRTAASGDNSFRSVVLSAVMALTQCIAMGGRLRETRWDLQIRANEELRDDGAFGDILSALLAAFFLYRSLPLYGSAPTVSLTEEEGLSFTSAALSALRPKPIGAFATTPGSNIYYLEPWYGEDGLPDLEDLDKMYAYVEALMADGKVLSARPAVGSLLSSLDEMSRDVTIEYLLDVQLPIRAGGLLIETECSLPCSLVARTERPESPEEPKNSDETESHS